MKFKELTLSIIKNAHSDWEEQAFESILRTHIEANYEKVFYDIPGDNEIGKRMADTVLKNLSAFGYDVIYQSE
jgi:UDP-N-acetylglucosamine enolpyruvyl transferase